MPKHNSRTRIIVGAFGFTLILVALATRDYFMPISAGYTEDVRTAISLTYVCLGVTMILFAFIGSRLISEIAFVLGLIILTAWFAPAFPEMVANGAGRQISVDEAYGILVGYTVIVVLVFEALAVAMVYALRKLCYSLVDIRAAHPGITTGQIVRSIP